MYEVHSKSSRTGRISKKVDVLSFRYFIYTFFKSILIDLSVFASFYANIIEFLTVKTNTEFDLSCMYLKFCMITWY